MGLIYGLIAAGYCQQSDSLWKGLIWPYYLGTAIARFATSERSAEEKA